MSNPTVTAQINVVDNASPAIKEMAELMQRLNKLMGGGLKSNSTDSYARSLRTATSAAREHLSVLEKINKVRSAVGATVAGYVGAKAVHTVEKIAQEYAPYEKHERYQNAVLHGTAADRTLLEKQRQDAASKRGLKLEDTLDAQNVFVQRSFSAPMTAAMTDPTLLGSQALGDTAKRVAKVVEGGIFGLNLHPHSPEDAKQQAQKAVDRATVANKKAGMSVDDIEAAQRFEYAAGSAAGFTPEQMMAINMTHARNNLAGPESGVFVRQLAARALAPTAMGLDAEAAAGMNHDNYYQNGDVGSKSMSLSMQRHFGKEFSKSQIAEYDRLIEEKPELAQSRAGIQSAVIQTYENTGVELSKTDAHKVSKAAGTQYDLARTGFDGKRWLEDFLHKFSDPQVLAYLGSKQGARGAVLIQNQETYDKYHQDQNNADGYAERIAKERAEGFGAALDRLTASVNSAEMEIGKANAVWMTPLANAATSVIGAFVGLSDSTKAALTVGAGVASLAGLAAAGATVIKAMAAIGSLAVSAGAAAVALDKVALGGAISGKLPAATPAVPGVGPVASTASKGARFLNGAASVLGWTGLGLTVIPLAMDGLNAIPDGSGGRRTHAGGTRGASAPRKFWDNVPLPTESTVWHSSKKIAPDVASKTNEALKTFNAQPYTPDTDVPDNWGVGAGLKVNRNVGEGDSKWGPQPAVGDKPVTVTGDLTGTANITANISVTPSPLFFSEINNIKADILRLKGQAGSSKTGVNMGGSNGAQPVSQPSGGSH